MVAYGLAADTYFIPPDGTHLHLSLAHSVGAGQEHVALDVPAHMLAHSSLSCTLVSWAWMYLASAGPSYCTSDTLLPDLFCLWPLRVSATTGPAYFSHFTGHVLHLQVSATPAPYYGPGPGCLIPYFGPGPLPSEGSHSASSSLWHLSSACHPGPACIIP